MNKDVIYIDVDDDITAIIGKLKASKEKVVALVPPKHVGVLQSAVNLRLLARAAKQSGKHLALVTNNSALSGLAASANIPVAKTLQSQPELAEIPALKIDDDDDIIDGASLPVGDHAAQGTKKAEDTDKTSAMVAALAEAPAPGESPAKPKTKSGPKVPNFNKFRKRLLFGIGGGIVLILFLIWAIVIAPRATIIISAKTSASSINQNVTFTAGAQTSLTGNVIKAEAQSLSATKTAQFTATGQKDAGSKATGTVVFSSGSISALGKTIPAGTQLTDTAGNVFTTDTAVTMTQQGIYATGKSTMTAAQNGSQYNASTGSMTGAPSGISANIQGSTSGGVTKMITVVSADDVQKAKQSIASQSNDDVKNSLKSKFDSDSIVMPDSFAVDYTDVKISPDVGEEASTATLSTTATYKMYGVSRSEISTYLDAYLKNQLNGAKDQKVYDNGSKKAQVQDVAATSTGATAVLIATAQVGPKIDDNQIKAQSKGKRFGDIQQSLEAIQGVEDVNVTFFPFWVNTVPGDNSRITVEFKLK